NHIDDDCDGSVDENDDALQMSCNTGAGCPPDAKEICDNQLDDDCNGFVDEGCPVPEGKTAQKCWTGSLLALGQARSNDSACREGHQNVVNGYWGPCLDEVLPSLEKCGDNIDSDCNGLGASGEPEDPFCCVPQAEICNGMDDDCDGVIDNGL